MNIELKKIKEIEEYVTSKNYIYKWEQELCSLIKSDKSFYHYFSAGNLDGSGAVYPFMYELIKHFKSQHVVELGNREGMGVMAIYSALKENATGILSTIDIIEDLRYVPEHVKTHKQIDFIFGDVAEESVINKVKKDKPKIDFILFDTIHTYDQMKIEWEKYEPLLANEAIVLIDDLDYERDPQNKKQRFFYELEKYEKYSSKNIHSSGFGVVFYERNKKQVSNEEYWDNIWEKK